MLTGQPFALDQSAASRNLHIARVRGLGWLGLLPTACPVGYRYIAGYAGFGVRKADAMKVAQPFMAGYRSWEE